MKKIYFKSLFATLLLLYSSMAGAHDFESGGIYYKITDAAAKTVSVTYKGNSYGAYSNTYVYNVRIPSTVVYDGNTYLVTAIGDNTFNGCTGLEGITIPNSVTSIGNSAFYGCVSLESVNIPNSVTSIGYSAFENCTTLTSIVIPNNVTEFVKWNGGGDAATFRGCTKLKSVTIGSGVTELPNRIFWGCKSLASITIPDNITRIGGEAFAGCSALEGIVIPNSVVELGFTPQGFGYNFADCTSLKSVTIGSGIKRLPSYVFLGCTALTDITIPNNVQSMGGFTFYGCTSLASITIPNSVTGMGSSEFYGCTALESVTLSNNIGIIGNEVFRDCTSLVNMVIPDKVTRICTRAFRGCSALTNIEIPNSVTSIENSAFYGCTALASITIPSYVASLSSYAFYGCSSLKNVTIPSGVEYVASFAFAECTGLTSVSMPNSVGSIHNQAFEGCTSLKEVAFSGNLSSIGEKAFYNCTSLVDVNIPKGVINKSAFSNCSSMSIATLGDGVTGIGESAFENCISLHTIKLGEGVTSIGARAFLDTKWYRDHTDGVLYLGKWLIGYKNIKPKNSYAIVSGTKGIADYALSGCVNLTGIDIPGSVEYIGNDAFYDCYGLESLRIPVSVKDIKESAFSGCSGIKEAYIDCKEVNNAFRKLTAVKDVYLGNNVELVGADAFYGCTALESVSLSENVKSIGRYAFKDCRNLVDVVTKSKFIKIADSSTFHDINAEAVLTYPAGCDYSAWAPFFKSMVADKVLYLRVQLKEAQALHDAATEGVHYGNYLPGSKAELQKLLNEVNAALEGTLSDEELQNYIEQVSAGINSFNSQIVSDYMNNLYFIDTEALTRTQATLSLNMKNISAISSCQFDISLPAGITFATDGEGAALVDMSTERTSSSKHKFESAIQADGSLRVICYSNTNSTFSGTEGEIFKVTINIGDNLLDQDYDIYIKNITLSEADGKTKYDIPLSASKINISTYILGDADDDRALDIADVTEVVTYILSPAYDELNKKAADANEDLVIDVADVTTIIAMILGTDTASAAPAKAAATRAGEISTVSADGDGSTLLININNPGYPFSAIQFDLELPEGIEVDFDGEYYAVDLGSRTNSRKHSYPECAIQPDGSLRVVIISMSNALYNGTTGDVATAALKVNGAADGDYQFTIKNVVLSAPGSKEKLEPYTGWINVTGGVTGIDEITADGAAADGAIYDLQGRKVSNPVKGGVYIQNGEKIIF